MNPMTVIGVMVALGLWVAAAYMIWRWGPGVHRYAVWCPVMKKPATILAAQREKNFRGSYAGLTMANVKECSLVDGAPMGCHQECIQHS